MTDSALGILAIAVAVAIVMITFWRTILVFIGLATLASLIACVLQIVSWIQSLS